MSKKITFTVLLIAALAASAIAQNVVIPAGTDILVSNKSDIATEKLKIGDDLNFTLMAPIVVGALTIPEGTEILGRVLEVEKFDKKKGQAHVVMMFEFVKVGEEFYFVKATIDSTAEKKAGLSFAKSKDFEGGTVVLMKGKELSIAPGTSFNVKIAEDVTDA